MGEGELLAEELYNHTLNVGRHALTGEYERTNLAGRPGVATLKRHLARALETRPLFIR